MFQIKDLRHININQFIGACVDPNNISIITSYCSKGSLQDVLHNDNIKLDWIFKLSFASDIAKVKGQPAMLWGWGQEDGEGRLLYLSWDVPRL